MNIFGGTRLLFPVVENSIPSGGRKFIYHVVDMLNEAGIEAWVVHPDKAFRLTWFDNQTRVGYTLDLFPKQKARGKKNRLKYWWETRRKQRTTIQGKLHPQQLNIRETDILVIPESRLPIVHRMPSQCCKIIFNQNPYFTFFLDFSSDHQPSPHFFGENTLGMLVVSDINMAMQKFVFPELKLAQGKLFIENVFCYQPVKKRQIAYMPRRGANDASAVINMLKFRGLIDEVNIVSIDGINQAEVAEILSESLVFLSLAHREGFGLPAAEAMACGCIVIGYSGNGGDEYFDPKYCYPIREGDIETYVRTIEEVLQMSLEQPEKLNRMREQASELIRRRYSRDESKRTIVAAFRKLLSVSDS